MKRVYQKPGIYIENMTLSQSIASGCNMPDNYEKPNHDEGTCGYEIFPEGIIWAANMSCKIIKNIDIPFNGVCYNNPSGGISIFSS